MNNRAWRGLAFVLAFAVLSLSSRTTSAMASTDDLDGHFGLGLQLGAPWAITGKYWLNKQQALQGYIGFFDGGFNVVGVDWVYQLTRIRLGREVDLGVHIGVGGVLGFGDGNCFNGFGDNYCAFDHPHDRHLALGARVPVAANFFFKSVPIEAYLELAPVFEFIPDFAGDLMLGLGGRFYF
jgi:hypothetical protein